MNRVIITGPTGAIGTALIEHLIRKNVEVTAVCRPASKRINNIPKSDKVRIIECSLEELPSLKEILTGTYDTFYHFGWAGTFGAARNDMYLQNKNVQCTLDAVELARSLGCDTFIGAGSQAEYGRVEGVLTPETPVFPENGYGIAKLCAGQMSRIKCKEYGIRHIWTRILSVYGPHDGMGTMVMSTIQKLLDGERPQFTPGEQKWDYLYAEDAAAMMGALGEKGRDGQVYCLGGGTAKPLCEYIYQIRDAVSPGAELGIGDIPYNDKQVMYLCADISKLAEDTGYLPKFTFEQGIEKTVRWFKEGRGL